MRPLYVVLGVIAAVVVVLAVIGALAMGGAGLDAHPGGSGQVQTSAAP